MRRRRRRKGKRGKEEGEEGGEEEEEEEKKRKGRRRKWGGGEEGEEEWEEQEKGEEEKEKEEKKRGRGRRGRRRMDTIPCHVLWDDPPGAGSLNHLTPPRGSSQPGPFWDSVQKWQEMGNVWRESLVLNPGSSSEFQSLCWQWWMESCELRTDCSGDLWAS